MATINCTTHQQAGGDVLVNAATGSGKTLAYLAPIVDRLAAQRPRVSRDDGTRCLVVAPTRELVLQIQAVLAMLLKRFAYLVRSSCVGRQKRSNVWSTVWSTVWSCYCNRCYLCSRHGWFSTGC